MTRLRRSFVAAIFALAIASMQYATLLHALEHAKDLLGHSREHSLTARVDERCVLCLLLASGANALPGEAASAPAMRISTAFSHPPLSSPAQAAPSYYSSRAPPLFL
jgi:hypothetical protein